MRLSDIMSHTGLWGWTVAAMVLFIAVYIAQVIWTFSARNRQTMERGGTMPLDQDRLVPADAKNQAAPKGERTTTEVGHG